MKIAKTKIVSKKRKFFLMLFVVGWLLFFRKSGAASFFSDAPDLTSVVKNLMFLMLKILGGLVVVAFAVAGTMFLTSHGEEEKIETAKRYFKYIIIGTALGLLGLAVIMQLDTLFS
jgi:hypothetical protein